MKKRFLLILFAAFIFSAASLFAQDIVFFTAEKPEITITQNIDYNLFTDEETECLGFSSVIDVNAEELLGSAGIYANTFLTEMYSTIVYWPSFTPNINFGVGCTYHMCYWQQNVFEQNILADLYLGVHTADRKFEGVLKGGLLTKVSDIFINNSGYWITELSWDLGLKLQYKLTEDWMIYGSYGTYSLFEYPLDFDMYLTLGCENKIMDNITVGSNVHFKNTDCFTISTTVNQLGIELYTKVSL